MLNLGSIVNKVQTGRKQAKQSQDIRNSNNNNNKKRPMNIALCLVGLVYVRSHV